MAEAGEEGAGASPLVVEEEVEEGAAASGEDSGSGSGSASVASEGEQSEGEQEDEQEEVQRGVTVTVTVVKLAKGHSYEKKNNLDAEVKAAGLNRRYMLKFMREKWRTVPTPLPPNIHVWSYRKRIDLMRAIIVGAPGTIFQDALFWFDFRISLHYPMVPLEITFRGAFPGLYKLGEMGRVPEGTLFSVFEFLNRYWTGPAEMELRMPVRVDLTRVDDRRDNLGETLLWLQTWIQSGHQFLWERGPHASCTSSWQAHEICVFMNLKAILHMLQDPPKVLSRFVHRHFQERRHRILHTYETCAWALGGFQYSLELRGQVSKLLPALRAALPEAKVTSKPAL